MHEHVEAGAVDVTPILPVGAYTRNWKTTVAPRHKKKREAPSQSVLTIDKSMWR